MLRKEIIIACLIGIMVMCSCSRSTESLIQNLHSEDASIRMNAGIILGSRFGDTEVVDKLIELIDDEDQRAAFIAVQLLSSLADVRAVEPLGRLLDHPDPDFRANACWSIGSIGHESGIPYLIKGLSDTASVVRHHAVTGIGFIHYAPAAKELFRMFRDPVDSVRTAAIGSHYLYRLDKDAFVYASDLAFAIDDQSELVRYVAVQALGGGYPDTTIAGDLLIDALYDESKFVKLEAINSIKNIKYKDAVPVLKQRYDILTVEEEFAITEAIMEITGEVFPPDIDNETK